MFVLIFAILFIVDFLITAVVTVHIFTPEMYLLELGIPWLGMMPGLTVLA